jgi:hypothetical protein
MQEIDLVTHLVFVFTSSTLSLLLQRVTASASELELRGLRVRVYRYMDPGRSRSDGLFTTNVL